MAKSQVLSPDVLIVGAGIAGCPLAVALARRGLNVLLTERMAQQRRLFKGEYLQPAAVRTLKDLGFGSVFDSSTSVEIESLRFRDLDLYGDPQSSLLMHYPEGLPARSIEYFDLIAGLTAHTKLVLGNSFWQGVTLSPEGETDASFFKKPVFTCEHPTRGHVTIRPKWVIGCDGRSSTVRKWLGGPAPARNGKVVLGTTPEFIFGAQIPERLQTQHVYQVVRTAGQGTVSYFSLGDSGQRIYLSARAALQEGAPQTTEIFRHILAEIRLVTGHGPVPDTFPVSGYPANTEWFGPAGRGQCLLVGDALAVTTPYGGQGMTIAMEHVRYLADQFDFGVSRKTQLGESLDGYRQFTQNTFDRVNFLNFGLYYTFFSRPTVFKFSTKQIIERWERSEDLKMRVARLFGGIDTDMPTLSEILDLESVPFTRAALDFAPRLIRRVRWS